MKDDKYYRKHSPQMAMYIEEGGIKSAIDSLVDPAPTIFETSNETEVRFNVMLNEENYLKYHALNHLEDRVITVGILYDNNVELKSTFTANHYERRFGSGKGSIVTHVIKGIKSL
jgi:hypothetical protein